MTESLDADNRLDDARARLLAAAEVIFAEKGFGSSSVREICKAAGVNIASISYYFGDKERLYVECLKAAHDCADAGPEFGEFDEGTLAVEKLRRFLQIMARRMHAPARSTALQLLMREFANPSAAGQEVIFEYIRPKALRLRGVLQELLPGADERRLMMIGFSVMGQVLFYRQNRPVVEQIFGKEAVNELDSEAVVEHVTRFTLAALGFELPYPAGSPAASAVPEGGAR
jgi:TetR/AcrR family transcriptional regulator, regulator of cefoperazone and chloramphenicol sensitivity